MVFYRINVYRNLIWLGFLTGGCNSVLQAKFWYAGVTFSWQSDEQQLTPFADRRSKLYVLKPLQAPESLYVQDDDTRRTSLSCLVGRDSTMYYSPEVASTPEFMSALDELQSESPVNKHHRNRLASPNTSTPKTRHAAGGQRTRASLSTVYRFSGTCCICLQEKADDELISHDKCGSLFCRHCVQVGVSHPLPKRIL